MKALLAIILLASSALAQGDHITDKDKGEIAGAVAACGPEETKFDLKTSNAEHSVAQPEAGKALFYVIGQDGTQQDILCKGCEIVARVGLNGDWIGAVNGNSFLSSSVAPGEYHLCTQWQSRFSIRSKRLALANFNAEAGKIYYFRMRLTRQGNHAPLLDLEEINSDEGKYLVLTSQTSTSHSQK
ncbi:MAG TPA: hypothetical protein VGK36_03485 [Candidatus Angelobacter sp.]|jgi:hypothetical protein